MMTNVLELCDIPESIDIDKLKQLITQYIEPRLGYYKEHSRCLAIEDDFSEYFTALASNGEEIGNGNCGMDVKTQSNEGIDATCVIMNTLKSNEKSIIQNFKSSGNNLDILFKEDKHDDAVRAYMDDYKNKLLKVKMEKKLNDLYILAFISDKNDIYLACFKINIDNINDVKSNGFISNNNTKTAVNIDIHNFIDSNYGNVNLYKSKKRVELRFKKKLLLMPNVVKIYSSH
jgi:hypothetical protein